MNAAIELVHLRFHRFGQLLLVHRDARRIGKRTRHPWINNHTVRIPFTKRYAASVHRVITVYNDIITEYNIRAVCRFLNGYFKPFIVQINKTGRNRIGSRPHRLHIADDNLMPLHTSIQLPQFAGRCVQRKAQHRHAFVRNFIAVPGSSSSVIRFCFIVHPRIRYALKCYGRLPGRRRIFIRTAPN